MIRGCVGVLMANPESPFGVCLSYAAFDDRRSRSRAKFVRLYNWGQSVLVAPAVTKKGMR